MSGYGLLGEHLAHSYSPQIHACFGDYPYQLYEVAPSQLAEFLQHCTLDGLNVTIPYKQAVVPFCTALTWSAKQTGSVNTMLRQPDGSWLGENTDYAGFAYLLAQTELSLTGKKALVLGGGGAAKTVQAVLQSAGAGKIIEISRQGPNHYGTLPLHADAQLVVNCTPLGMYPENGQTPLDLSIFPQLEAVIDLIYNPARTQLLLDAEVLGIPAYGGLAMLVAQAAAAAELFLGQPLADNCLEAVQQSIAKQQQNIALIGMPGCGKTTIGRALSEITGRPFRDLDAAVEQAAGCSIPEFFASHGEAAFRRLETEQLRLAGKESGLVIATGGGVVTQPENYALLRQNSIILFLDRPLEELQICGRPLSLSQPLAQLAEARMPAYRSWAEARFATIGVRETAAKIKEALAL